MDKIIVYGLGSDYEEHKAFIEKKYEVVGVSDSDLKKKDKYSNFIEKECLTECEFDKILICSEDYYSEIKEELLHYGIDRSRMMGMDGTILNLKGRDPIIVVKFTSGTGNLMFQYALYLKLKLLNKDIPVKADITWYYQEENVTAFHIPWIFERIFHLELPIASTEEIAESRRQKKYFEKELARYDENIERIHTGYIWGYWQTSKYFKDIEDMVRKAFCFNERYLSDRQRRMLYKIRDTKNSAAVWIRRGDYISTKEMIEYYGNICTEEYYEKAMKYINNEIGEEANFIIFSNDPDYVKDRYKGYLSMTYADNSMEYFDMSIYLMSQCEHIIMANSTFSWWAAWLHEKNGIVISPKRFINGLDTPDIWQEDWIKI